MKHQNYRLKAEKLQAGLSLVELLVAVIFIGFLVLVLSQSLITTIRSNLKAEIQKEIKENGDYALEYIGRTVRNGKAIMIRDEQCKDGAIVTGVLGDTMTVTNQDDTQTTILCGDEGRITVDGVPVTSESVEVSVCTLECTSQSLRPSAVTLQVTLKQLGEPEDSFEKAEQTFSSTFTLRNK